MISRRVEDRGLCLSSGLDKRVVLLFQCFVFFGVTGDGVATPQEESGFVLLRVTQNLTEDFRLDRSVSVRPIVAGNNEREGRAGVLGKRTGFLNRWKVG